MNDTTQDLRGRRLDEVVKLVAAKVAPEQRATLQAFVARYFGQVDPEELMERPLGDLYGAALSHWNFARKRQPGRSARPGVQSHDRRAWLGVDAHDRRDRQRRHAVSCRFGGDGSQPPRPDAASDHASDHRGRTPGRRHAHRPRHRQLAHARARIVHPRRSRPHRPARATRGAGRRPDARARRRARRRRRLEGAGGHAPRHRRGRQEVAAAAGCGRVERGRRFPRVARRQPFRHPRLSLPRPGDDRRAGCVASRCRIEPRHPSRDRQQGCRGELRGAAARGQGVRAATGAPRRHQVDVAVHRASAGLSRLHRGQALQRRRCECAASTVSSACSPRPRTAPIRPKSRCCAGRPRMSSRARICRRAVTPRSR